ncbi:ATP-binding protein [Actinacidiphila oryziradicis]|uniref:ATP-binding protein n=1 Tax=Actinacidiphila oryziradicis TaxID=2571141 RepID=UPI0023EFA7F4|nr:ATP-binding protein [Actinacidiphila oryziradicis]MCW2871573.1 ATP-binding region ATPase domain protein [Actinacidiphila oryziradicis]
MAPIDTMTFLAAHPASASGIRREAFELPVHDASVGEARRRVRTLLSRCTFSEEACYTATLVISELVTNALKHTAGKTVSCLLRADDRHIHLQVTDQGADAGEPKMREAGAGDENGRGLQLVNSLADGWGVATSESGQGHVVWAVLRAAG